MTGTTTTPEQKQSYSFLDVPEIRVWASGDLLIIRSAALGKERRINLADLGIHLQNTDSGTKKGTFEIAYQSENQNPNGITSLAFGGKQGGRRAAIGFHWDEAAGDFELKQCLNYTGGPNDSWVNIGSGAPSTTSSVRWQAEPQVAIAGDLISATTGVAIVNEVLKDILAEDIIENLPALGFMRPCLLVGNYLATPGRFEVISGATVAENASFAYPPLPGDRLLVTPFIVRNSGIQQTSPNPVTSITLNGIPEKFPNATGKLYLTIEGKDIDTTVADPGFFGLAAGITKLKIKAAIDAVAGKIGNLSALATTNKNNLVAAINEVKSDIGTNRNFTGTIKTGSDNTRTIAFNGAKVACAEFKHFGGMDSEFTFSLKKANGSLVGNYATLGAWNTAVNALAAGDVTAGYFMELVHIGATVSVPFILRFTTL